MTQEPVDIGNGLKALVEFAYGEKHMDHLRKAPEAPHRTTTVTIKVMKGDDEVGTATGVSYCSPYDQFDKVMGRRLALIRAFADGKNRCLPRTSRERLAELYIKPAAQKRSASRLKRS